MMMNIPEVKLGLIAVSRDCFPIALSEKRRANISGAYTVTDPELIEGKRILLIDDIITSGSTLGECARMLREAGAAEVLCATVARSRE